MDSVRLRLRLFIAEYGELVTAIFLVFALVGGAGLLWGVLNPPTTEVTETTYQDTVSSEVTTSAVLTNDTGLFQQGTRVRNFPTYPRAWSNRLTIHVLTSLPDNRRAQVTHTITLIYRVTIGERTIKREQRQLTTASAEVTDGESLANATVNITRIDQHRNQLADAVGEFGSVGIFVRVDTAYQTDQYTGGLSATGPLEITDNSYSLGEGFAASRVHEDTRTRRVTQQRPVSAYVPWFGIFLVGLVGAGLTWRTYTHERSRRDVIRQDAIQERIQRSRYDEWIVEGRLSSPPTEETLEITSLEGLFELAIATESRVIHDSTNGLYAVVDASHDLTYHYREWPSEAAGESQDRQIEGMEFETELEERLHDSDSDGEESDAE